MSRRNFANPLPPKITRPASHVVCRSINKIMYLTKTHLGYGRGKCFLVPTEIKKIDTDLMHFLAKNVPVQPFRAFISDRALRDVGICCRKSGEHSQVQKMACVKRFKTIRAPKPASHGVMKKQSEGHHLKGMQCTRVTRGWRMVQLVFRRAAPSLSFVRK